MNKQCENFIHYNDSSIEEKIYIEQILENYLINSIPIKYLILIYLYPFDILPHDCYFEHVFV
jgi:hypothetical protein